VHRLQLQLTYASQVQVCSIREQMRATHSHSPAAVLSVCMPTPCTPAAGRCMRRTRWTGMRAGGRDPLQAASPSAPLTAAGPL
jgi:hypothetical protein